MTDTRFTDTLIWPSLANLTRYISYGPLRHSSLALVDKHEETGIDMEPHLPNDPQNMANAVLEDPEWWADNQDDVNERFAAWLTRGTVHEITQAWFLGRTNTHQQRRQDNWI